MDIYLDAKTSLKLYRIAARNKTFALRPSDKKAPQALGLRVAKPYRLGIPGLLSLLRVPESAPLGILVPRAKDRVRCSGIACTIMRSPRGEVPFMRLESTDATSSGTLEPKDGNVFVLAPTNVVLGMAKVLRQKELQGSMSHQRAVLSLAKLCLELCGTFSHDPFDPRDGEVVYKTTPVTSKEELAEFVKDGGREQGLALLREVVPLVFDKSGSPQESFLGAAMFFPGRLGGLRLCDYATNTPLKLTRNQRASIGYRVITPDFTLVGYNAVMEYLGSVHEEGDNPRIDHVRSLDYQTLGIREYAFWYADVRTQSAFMRSAARVLHAVEQVDGPEARRRFARLANDSAFQKRQRVLMEVFMPWKYRQEFAGVDW